MTKSNLDTNFSKMGGVSDVYKRLKKSSLNEDGGGWSPGGENRLLQDKFKTMATADVVPIVNAHTGWSYEKIADLVHDLLVDANFHSEAGKVYDFMMNLD